MKNALLGKQLCSLATKEDSLWINWVNDRYTKDTNFWSYAGTTNASWHWKKLIKLEDTSAGEQSWMAVQDGQYIAAIGYEWMIGGLPRFPFAKTIWCRYNVSNHSFILQFICSLRVC